MGPASAASSTGGTGVVIPPGQEAASGTLGQIFGPLANASMNGGAGTPAGQAYPVAQNFVQQFLTGNGSGTGQFQDFLNNAIGTSQTASSYGPTLFDQGTSGAGGLYGAASGGLPFANTALSQGFSPAYGSLVSNLQQNPFYQTSLDGALQGANFGRMGGDQLYGLTQQTVGSAFNPLYENLVNDALTNPYYPAAMAGAQAGAGYGKAGASGLAQAGQQLLTTGFDPQSALFNRQQQQVTDQSNAVNAMSGLAGTPYGASVTSNALGNFDLNWQNAQLARQSQAAGAAAPLLQAAPSLAAGSAALPTQALYNQIQGIEQPLQAQLGAYGSGLGSAASGLSAAAGLPTTTGAAPSSVFQQQLSSILGGLRAQQQGGALGAGTFGSLLGSSGSGLSGSQNLGYGSATNSATLGGLPYNTGTGIASNALAGLNQQTQLGNNQYQLPQQAIGDLMQYLGLGQSASGLSGQLGQMGFNQLGQGIGGLGSLLGLGGGGFGGGGAFGGLGSLLGLGGGGGAGGGGLLSGLGSLFGLGGAGGGGGFAAAAPFAAALL